LEHYYETAQPQKLTYSSYSPVFFIQNTNQELAVNKSTSFPEKDIPLKHEALTGLTSAKVLEQPDDVPLCLPQHVPSTP